MQMKPEKTGGRGIAQTAVRVSVTLLMLTLGFPAAASGPDQVTDSTPVIEAPGRARRMMEALFDDGEPGALEDA